MWLNLKPDYFHFTMFWMPSLGLGTYLHTPFYVENITCLRQGPLIVHLCVSSAWDLQNNALNEYVMVE